MLNATILTLIMILSVLEELLVRTNNIISMKNKPRTYQ